jgi:hypothetical protein
MENAENPFVLVKEKKLPKRWLANGRCGFNYSKTTPHLL